MTDHSSSAANNVGDNAAAGRIAIIGAGIAGLACARALTDAGLPVTLFDKARGPGGRMSSRRRPDAIIDLGAQAFSARDPAFIAELDAWRRAGCAERWPTHAYRASNAGWQRLSDDRERFTGAPRMSAITRHLAQTLAARGTALHAGTRVSALERHADGWQIRTDAGAAFGPYTEVVVAVPPPQAEPLVQPWDNTLDALCQRLEQRACWAGWAIFAAPLPVPDGVTESWQQAHLQHPALRLVSRNQTKPGREHQPESLSLLAHTEWSEAHLEDDAKHVAMTLISALKALFPASQPLPELVDHGAHRWLYAQPAEPLAAMPDAGFALGHAGLSLCGDGLRGGRVEEAWLSGHRLGQTLAGCA